MCFTPVMCVMQDAFDKEAFPYLLEALSILEDRPPAFCDADWSCMGKHETKQRPIPTPSFSLVESTALLTS